MSRLRVVGSMSRFEILETPLAGVRVVCRKPLSDSRGDFTRIFCTGDLAELLDGRAVAQINFTRTRESGVIRGMHFQRPPFAEMKLVTCLRGEIWDVAVDLRSESQTFLQHHAEVLSAGNSRALLIPEGVAHGFQTLSDEVEILYCHTRPYSADAEGGLNPLDPKLGISWPLPVRHLSERDQAHALIGNDFQGIAP